MKRYLLIALLVLALLTVVGCKKEPPAPAPTPGEATGLDGAAILQEKCTVCHSLERVEAAQYDDVGWEQVIERMREKGADLTDDEATALAEYLSLQ
jgi:cytochrome c5